MMQQYIYIHWHSSICNQMTWIIGDSPMDPGFCCTEVLKGRYFRSWSFICLMICWLLSSILPWDLHVAKLQKILCESTDTWQPTVKRESTKIVSIASPSPGFRQWWHVPLHLVIQPQALDFRQNDFWVGWNSMKPWRWLVILKSRTNFVILDICNLPSGWFHVGASILKTRKQVKRAHQ